MANDDVHGAQRLHVFIVEDNDDARASLKDILELDDHVVYLAATATEALNQPAELASADVVILDRKLPDGLAEKLLPAFRRQATNADFIVVTGFADFEGTIAAMREGASDYIIKPINPEALRQSLQRIAERRQIERELHEERRFADLVLQTAEAIVLVLDTEGRVVRFNPFLTELTGFSLEEVQGCDWFDTFIPEPDRDRVRHVFKQTVKDVSNCGILNPVLTKSGDERDVRWSNTTLMNEDGQATGVLSVGLDVTDLVQAQKRLLQSERLAAIGQTMAGMAHESRNALQRLQNATELLQDDLEDNPSALRDVAKIERACNDLRDLLNEVRDYAAPIQLDLEEISLSSIWRRTWSDIEAHRNDRDVVFHEFTTEPDIALIDKRRMEQVFRNLFENALDACEDPVEIRVECRTTDDSIITCIQDNGPGLPSNVKDKIFDAFFTTKPTGTGLGLAIVDRIIDAHHGSISVVDSEVGTRYQICLPIKQA